MPRGEDHFDRFLNHPNLPSPTGVALEVIGLSERPESTVDQFVEVIRTDQALVQRILQIINSPFAGVSRPIADVRQACILLGIKTVAVIALGVSLIDSSKKTRCAAFSYRMFWSESLARAVAMRHIASLRKFDWPEEAFVLGLLADIGRLVFANVAPAEYAGLLARTDDLCELAELERDAFGLDHDELTARLLQKWGLPQDFCAMVWRGKPPPSPGGEREAGPTCGLGATGGLSASDVGHPTGGQAARGTQTRRSLLGQMLHAASAVAALVVKPYIEEEELKTLAGAAEGLGLTAGESATMFDAIAEEWRLAGAVLDVSTRTVPKAADIYARATTKREELRAAGGLHHFVEDA